jgi:hypothetical protein
MKVMIVDFSTHEGSKARELSEFPLAAFGAIKGLKRL